MASRRPEERRQQNHLLSCLPNLGCFQKDDGTGRCPARSPASSIHQMAAHHVVAPGASFPKDDAADPYGKLHQTMQWLLEMSSGTEPFVDVTMSPDGLGSGSARCPGGSGRRGQQTIGRATAACGLLSPPLEELSSGYPIVHRHCGSDSSFTTSSTLTSCSVDGLSPRTRSASLSHRDRPRRKPAAALPPSPPESLDDSVMSCSSATSSTRTLSTEMVVLDLGDPASVKSNVQATTAGLGLTILGRRPEAGGGIFVGCVKSGGAAERSGRVRLGDRLVAVNGIQLTRMSNEDALKTLREQVNAAGVVHLLVGRCNWNDSYDPRLDDDFYGLPSDLSRRGSLVRPGFDCSYTSGFPFDCLPRSYSSLQLSSTSSSGCTSPVDPRLRQAVVVSKSSPCPSFVGRELVEWIQKRLGGGGCLVDRSDAIRYAAGLLGCGYIRMRKSQAAAASGDCGRTGGGGGRSAASKFCEQSVYEFVEPLPVVAPDAAGGRCRVKSPTAK